MRTRAILLIMCSTELAVGGVGGSVCAHEHGPAGNQMAEEAAHRASAPPVSFADLEATVDALKRARQATEKYQDVRLAEADGYRDYGPYVPGMGIHYVNALGARGTVDIEHPPILLYEKDESAPGALRLVGVSYLLAAPTGPDGQPATTPFPHALATWHKHADLCLYPDRSVRVNMNGPHCQQQGGRFIAETDWMVHAWIWKDSPAGVFSPINPNVD
jgi:hypothetical protein